MRHHPLALYNIKVLKDFFNTRALKIQETLLKLDYPKI